MEVLKKGTIESLVVAMRDRLGILEDLSTVTGLVFDTKKKSDDSAVQTGVTATVHASHPMSAICTINTTLGAYVGGEEYKLYVRYTSGTESPVKGPVFFRVEDD